MSDFSQIDPQWSLIHSKSSDEHYDNLNQHTPQQSPQSTESPSLSPKKTPLYSPAQTDHSVIDDFYLNAHLPEHNTSLADLDTSDNHFQDLNSSASNLSETPVQSLNHTPSHVSSNTSLADSFNQPLQPQKATQFDESNSNSSSPHMSQSRQTASTGFSIISMDFNAHSGQNTSSNLQFSSSTHQTNNNNSKSQQHILYQSRISQNMLNDHYNGHFPSDGENSPKHDNSPKKDRIQQSFDEASSFEIAASSDDSQEDPSHRHIEQIDLPNIDPNLDGPSSPHIPPKISQSPPLPSLRHVPHSSNTLPTYPSADDALLTPNQPVYYSLNIHNTRKSDAHLLSNSVSHRGSIPIDTINPEDDDDDLLLPSERAQQKGQKWLYDDREMYNFDIPEDNLSDESGDTYSLYDSFNRSLSSAGGGKNNERNDQSYQNGDKSRRSQKSTSGTPRKSQYIITTPSNSGKSNISSSVSPENQHTLTNNPQGIKQAPNTTPSKRGARFKFEPKATAHPPQENRLFLSSPATNFHEKSDHLPHSAKNPPIDDDDGVYDSDGEDLSASRAHPNMLLPRNNNKNNVPQHQQNENENYLPRPQRLSTSSASSHASHIKGRDDEDMAIVDRGLISHQWWDGFYNYVKPYIIPTVVVVTTLVSAVALYNFNAQHYEQRRNRENDDKRQ